MKTRPYGFLAGEGEVEDYATELHGYLWRFIRTVMPLAGGHISEYLDRAIEQAEREAATKLLTPPPGRELDGR